MSRLSIIIPLSGSIEQLEESLVSVLENRPADSQVIVVLNDLYRDPYDLKNEVCFVYATHGADWATCLNLALEAAEAPIVHVLAPGVEVDPGWADEALAHFDDHALGAVAPLVLKADAPDRVLAAGLAYHAGGLVQRLGEGRALASFAPETQKVLGPEISAGFYRKSALLRLGPFSSEVGPRLLGVDVALALETLGFDAILAPQCRVYASGFGCPRPRGFRQALQSERLFWRWVGRSGWFHARWTHAATVLGEMVLSMPRPDVALAQLAGRIVGAFSANVQKQHYRRLAQGGHVSPMCPTMTKRPHFLMDAPSETPHYD